MSRVWPPRFLFLLTISVLLTSIPKPLHAYSDPGSEVMIWQVAALAVAGCAFSARRILLWIRESSTFRSNRLAGFLFATLFAVIVSPLTLRLFDGHPLPRFNDLFLVGIVLTAYLFTWESSVYLLVISLLVSAWVLPPSGTFLIAGFSEWYRIASFAAIALFLLFLITRLKARGFGTAAGREESSFRMYGAAAGAD